MTRDVMKTIVTSRLRILLLAAFSWTILEPVISKIKGSTSVSIITGFIILAFISNEFIPNLEARLKFYQVTILLTIIDLIYGFSVIYLFVYSDVSDYWKTIILLTFAPVYSILFGIEQLKFNNLLARKYGHRGLMLLSKKLLVVESRIKILALVFVILLGAITTDMIQIKIIAIIYGIINLIISIYVLYYIKIYKLYN